jgi:hypothetical protein
MRRAIKISRFRLGGMAECEQCGGPPKDWTRERARQHADAQRHTVRFVVEDTTVYTPLEGKS